ncbi:MAG: hypothetical protein DCC55_37545 [Chloroflexi bacterium]|nr:MAG: hypothetical protein DCC55_37545 [Chloroflexota bacterium]
MQTVTQTVPGAKPMPKTTLWAGRILSALLALFLLFDGVIKVVNIQPVVDASILLGLPVDLAPSLGLLLLACVAVYLIPQTAILGAILLTGYLGGAVAIHARVGGELFSLVLPVLLGALLWGGLYLRDEHLRTLIPLRR